MNRYAALILFSACVLFVCALPSFCQPGFAQTIGDKVADQADRRQKQKAAPGKVEPDERQAAAEGTSEVGQPTVQVFSGAFIDDKSVNRFLLRQGMRLGQLPNTVAGETILKQLKSASKTIGVALPKIANDAEVPAFNRNYQSSLVMANLYDCGRCDKIHVATAGAVALSTDGLVLTNFHVINSPSKTFNFFVMTHDGKVFPVVEVLAADELNDLAVVRVKASHLTPALIAAERPSPMGRLHVISHPRDHYYSVSTGVVSRYSKLDVQGETQKWMEITAEFEQGSSGSGVFNQAGELVGVVARKHAIFNKTLRTPMNHSHFVYKAVPLSVIKSIAGVNQ